MCFLLIFQGTYYVSFLNDDGLKSRYDGCFSRNQGIMKIPCVNSYLHMPVVQRSYTNMALWLLVKMMNPRAFPSLRLFTLFSVGKLAKIQNLNILHHI